MKKILFIFTIISSLVIISLNAESNDTKKAWEEAKDGSKEAWTGTKKASKGLWDTVKSESQEIWKDGKKAVHDATEE